MNVKSAFIVIIVAALLQGCVSTPIRLPSTAEQVNKNSEVQQLLMLAAQNNILFHIPEATTRELEKTEVSPKCRQLGRPIWADKLIMYLSELKKRPEFFTRFHIIELKRGDSPQVVAQQDLDGATTLSIQFVKGENRKRVDLETTLPCSQSLAEYLNREVVKTEYIFPEISKLNELLIGMPERKSIPRLQFSNTFLSYLAERGVIFKFVHEISFQKTTTGIYVMAEVLDKLGKDSKGPFHQYVNYWFKEIAEKSLQANLVQFFAITPDKAYNVGIRVESEGDHARRVLGQSDLTYIFTSYFVENEQVQYVSLDAVNDCLRGFAEEMKGVRLRKPAATEPESFLRPGYSCKATALPIVPANR